MNSHAYANKLKELGDFLLTKPEFETPNGEDFSYVRFYYYSDKDGFLGAVKALGSGQKVANRDDFDFNPDGTHMLRLTANRSSVCRKVQEEKWECEPLLSQAEEAAIGA